MIRGLLLIFDGAASWDKIAKAERGLLFILVVHLLPLLTLTLGLEAYALTRLGEVRTLSGDIGPVPLFLALRYFVASFGLGLLAILGLAKSIQQVSSSLHEKAGFLQCFTAVAYGLSPLYLLHVPDALPSLPTWVCFGVGMTLSIMVIYHAVPSVLRPDPANAMGLYLITTVLVAVIMALVHFLALQVLHDAVNYHFWERLVR